MILLSKQEISKLQKKSGIYYLEINNKGYVGSSVSIPHRLKHHLWSMLNNRHHNRTIQNLYNKYSKAKFKIIEICSEDDLIIREKHYIDTLQPYCNHILDPIKIIRDETYKKRISDGLKKAYANGLEPVNKKTIYMYSLEGEYVREFHSLTSAATEYDVDVSGICSALNGRAKSSCGFMWSYEKLDKIESIKYNYKLAPVLQLDLKNNLIKKWDSMSIAAKELGLFSSNIRRAAINNRTCGNFKWKII